MGTQHDELDCGAHGSGSLAENCGNLMENLYDWFKVVDQFSVSVPVCVELVCSVLQEVENGVGVVAIPDGLGKGMRGKVYTRLRGIVRQRSI